MDEKDKHKEIGDFLRQLRKEKGFTGAELGKRIGYTQSHISGIENGQKGQPSFKFLMNYFSGLDFSSEEFREQIRRIGEMLGENGDDFVIEFSDKDEDDSDPAENREKYKRVDYENGSVEYYDFPINDLKYSLNDSFDAKYWGDNRLFLNEKRLVSSAIDSFYEFREHGIFRVLRSLCSNGEISEKTFKMYISLYAPSRIKEADEYLNRSDQ